MIVLYLILGSYQAATPEEADDTIRRHPAKGSLLLFRYPFHLFHYNYSLAAILLLVDTAELQKNLCMEQVL